jgi:hypothetical protein
MKPLSALSRIRNSADYAEEKTIPKKVEDGFYTCICSKNFGIV